MIKPLYDMVLVEKLDEDTQKIGGLFVPSGATTTYAKGTVVAVGSGRIEFGHQFPPATTIGDVVLFNPARSSDIKDEDKNYLLISERDIAAIV